MFKKLLIKEHKNRLSHNQFLQLKKLIHEENPLSAIASLNNEFLKKYLNKCILSNFIYLFSCNIKKKIIGYAIFARKPYYLFSEVKVFYNWYFNKNNSYLVTITGDGEYRFGDIISSIDILEHSKFGAVYGSTVQSRQQYLDSLDSVYGESKFLFFLRTL